MGDIGSWRDAPSFSASTLAVFNTQIKVNESVINDGNLE
jgi:hypothetical protein